MQLHKNLIIATQLFTETLPISSSTHVWLSDFFWTKFHPQAVSVASEAFMDLLFLPTFLVLIIFFRSHCKHLFKTFFKATQKPSSHLLSWVGILVKVLGFLIASTLSFVCVFFAFKFFGHNFQYATKNTWIPQAIGLCVTMLLQASTFFAPPQQSLETTLTLKKSIVIGLFQGLAALPGISRLNITLVAARWMNISPHRAFEFSTLMQITAFIGNLVRNILFPDNIFSPATGIQTYLKILSEYSWDTILTMIVFATLSYFGLKLTKRLNSAKELWKMSPYFLIPLTSLFLFH